MKSENRQTSTYSLLKGTRAYFIGQFIPLREVDGRVVGCYNTVSIDLSLHGSLLTLRSRYMSPPSRSFKYEDAL